MRVIFLDVDGVLNSQQWALKMFAEGVRVYAEDMLDPHALRLLKRLVDESNAKLVVSSSWRSIPQSMKALADQLDQYGMKVYDVTPRVGETRGKDITAWLNRHPGKHQYVILDDDSDMDEHAGHLVQTTFREGLRAEHVDQALEMFKC